MSLSSRQYCTRFSSLSLCWVALGEVWDAGTYEDPPSELRLSSAVESLELSFDNRALQDFGMTSSERCMPLVLRILSESAVKNIKFSNMSVART